MKKSCLFVLILFAVLWGIYFYFLKGHLALLPAVLLSFFGSLSLAMLIGGIKQVFLTMGNLVAIRKAEGGQPFMDGKTAIAIGAIRPEKSALQSPLFQDDCVLYEYEVFKAQRPFSGEDARQQPRDILYTGLAMCPCAVSSLQGKVRLLGFPDLKNFSEQKTQEKTVAARFLEYLGQTKFESAVGIKKLGLFSQISDLFSDTDGTVRQDWQLKKMPTAPDQLKEEIESSDLEWGEKAVNVGQPVVAIGRYSAEKMGIISQMGMGGMMNDLYPGDIATVRKQIIGNTLMMGIFSLVFFAFFHGVLALMLFKASGTH